MTQTDLRMRLGRVHYYFNVNFRKNCRNRKFFCFTDFERWLDKDRWQNGQHILPPPKFLEIESCK
jgi:hypothetical protein